MKKSILLLFVISCITTVDAQTGLKIKKLNFSYGAEEDMINDMSYHYFVDQIPLNTNFPLRNKTFNDSDFYSGICENPHLSLGLTLVHGKLENLEWRNTISKMENRFDQVSYYEDDQNGSGDYVTFSGSHNEYALESTILYRIDVFSFLKLYGGVGTNVGLTTNNTICYNAYYNIPESEIKGLGSDGGTAEEYEYINGCFETPNQLTQRVFYEVGAGIRFFKRVELGLNHRRGIGYRAGNGANAGTSLHSTNLSLAYILH